MATKNQLAAWSYRKRRHAFLLRHDRCAACGSREHLQLDHIDPRIAGGSTHDESNWQTLCATCNQVKGNRTMSLEQIREVRKVDAPAKRDLLRAPGATLSALPRVESPRILPTSRSGRPLSADTARFIAWALALPEVGAEPTDHQHGRWAPMHQVHVRGARWSLCPASCSRPVRWSTH
jgi:hypothetical protein